MNTRIKTLTALTILSSSSVVASSLAIDARGDAMGGVGVVSASYLTAPFYNPALVAIYRRNDDAGMLVPSLGVSYNDEDQMLDKIDDVINSPSAASLDALNGTQAKVDFGGAVAFGIPNRYLAANIFGKAYVENVATPDIDQTGSSDADRANKSAVKTASVAITEVGISLAKYQTLFGQHFSFGVSPKLQRVYTYTSVSSLNDFQLNNIRENSQGETSLNVDAGALWFNGPFRAGISAKNMLSKNIKTQSGTVNVGGRDINYGYEYQLSPLYTVGAGFVADYFQFSVDYDLNEEKKFTQFDDNVQMLRAGIEIDLVRQIQLRGGYMKNMARDSEGTLTAGIGLSPLNILEIDIAASYTSPQAMGASINFLTTY
ncbi:conjugal transfer protein TraF [Vibrio sp. 10N.286.49.C2]|uniref:conjugal transfer protein TraF n=1 Tax=unclassified Vibrio TaxID=2614977 RepID=UPI000C8461FB|nr:MULTISPECIES: conjugal transfer protein TraF [unclassified Vibrio]PMH38300.1 conjugal transfer protein TraF [Vibrio sp. 10N.286.49.C2]PMH55708.1 conjugal transfer protein TraF [Vibrio sp. 10N.286.49.B1]PMH79285.1 conjugal transfer protein TraF [Vibrio sp. 10N.286.48.B7]